MSPVGARLAADSDVAAVDALRAAALDEIAAYRGGALYPARPLPAPGDAARPLWVGVLDGTVVGYLAASASGVTGTVDAIYVDPGCRAVGVGATMLEEALAWMARSGCEGVDANALPG